LEFNRKIINESFWSFFGQFISVFAMLFGIRLITEYVEPSEYGQYIIFSGIAMLIFNIISGSLFQSFLRLIPENKEQSSEKSTLLSSKIILLFLYISLFFLALYFIFKVKYLFLIFVLFAYIISEHLVGFFKTLMNIKKKQKKYAFFQILLSLLRPTTATLIYIYYNNSFISIVYGFCIANIIVSLLFFGNTIFKDLMNSYKKKFYWNDFSEFFDFTKPLFFQKIFGWMLSNIDKYIIAFFLGTTATGKYAPIVSMVSMLYLTTSTAVEIIFRPYYFEYIANNKIKDGKEILKKYSIILLIVAVTFVAFFTLFDKQIVSLFLGENFRDYYYFLPILSIGFSFLMFGYLFENICYAYKKTWKVFWIESRTAIFNVIMLSILIYLYGIEGIPYAIVLTYIVHCFLGYNTTKNIA